MNCKEFKEEMDEWAGVGEFTPRPELEKHLAVCNLCSQELTHLKNMLHDFHLENSPEPDSFFWNKQSASIMERIQKKTFLSWFPTKSVSFFLLLILLLIAYETKWKTQYNSSHPPVALTLEEDEESLDDIIEDLDSEEIQEAIQSLENKNQRRVL